MKTHHRKVAFEFDYFRDRRRGFTGRHWDHSLKWVKRFIHKAIRREAKQEIYRERE